MDYNSTRSFTMTLAHRAVGDIRRGGFRQLRNYVDMCATLAKKPQQQDFFACIIAKGKFCFVNCGEQTFHGVGPT